MKPILNLTIERRWLDKIVSGEKREEYRSEKNRQVARLYLRKMKEYGIKYPTLPIRFARDFMVLRAGYRMDSPAAAVFLDAIEPREFDCRHPFHFAIVIGGVIGSGPYWKIREKFQDWDGAAMLSPHMGDKTCSGFGWTTGIRYEKRDNTMHTTIHCNNIGYFNAIHGIHCNPDEILADRCVNCAFRTPKKGKK